MNRARRRGIDNVRTFVCRWGHSGRSGSGRSSAEHVDRIDKRSFSGPGADIYGCLESLNLSRGFAIEGGKEGCRLYTVEAD